MKKPIEPPRHEIWKMFDAISPTYDRVNRTMTLGCDRYWRKKMKDFLPEFEAISLLDCATGTGDQIFSLFTHTQKIKRAIGIDLSKEMLALAKEKQHSAYSAKDIHFQEASLLALPYPSNAFECVTIAFGIRNVTDVLLALRETLRVLKPKGRLLILEGSIPQNVWIKPIFLFYLRHILTRIGGILSHNINAYRYLNQTIETFPCGERFCDLLKEAGFTRARAHPLMGGVVSIYSGDKGSENK
ncbi:MAG TPA: bifunctional demethylmenaquinone methyltransferase/2-methoxy-6-polyprenyl-1,4-benzoquinol methylase UbiE [Rhabdochlamydiaceae bacterium]|jgi:demethylmenaquinone methyltransferase/2-methoxy-6-polyprenyl-1,4-benzoquinol methylase